MERKLDASVKRHVLGKSVTQDCYLFVFICGAYTDRQHTDTMHIPVVGFQMKVHWVYHGSQQGPSALGQQERHVVRMSDKTH